MTTSLQTAAFVAKLLAPLSESEEQVRTPKYLRQIENDITLPWRKGMEYVDLAEARHAVNALEKRLGFTSSDEPSLKSYRALIEAEQRQCLIPSPTAKELRWKLRRAASTIGTPEIVAVIVADRARLGGAA